MLAEKLIFKHEVEIAEAVKETEKRLKQEAEERTLNTIIRMIKKGMSTDEIYELTEFPIDKIEKLQTH